MPERTLYTTAEYKILYVSSSLSDRNPDSVYGGTIVRIEGIADDIHEVIELPRAEALVILTQYLTEQLGRTPTERDFREFEVESRIETPPTSSLLGNKRVRATFPADSRDFLGSDSD